MIRCISPYRSSYGQYTPGETITDAVLEAVLLVDSPGSFEVVAERALNAPPAHRMMTGADSETRALGTAQTFSTAQAFVEVLAEDEPPAAAPVAAKPAPTKPRPRAKARAS